MINKSCATNFVVDRNQVKIQVKLFSAKTVSEKHIKKNIMRNFNCLA
jgi:ribosomal protein S24E